MGLRESRPTFQEAGLEAEQRVHDALDLPAILIQIENASALGSRQALLVEKHFVLVSWTVDVGPQQLALESPVILGEDLDARRTNTFMLVLKAVVGASYIPPHHSASSCWLQARTRRSLRATVFPLVG